MPLLSGNPANSVNVQSVDLPTPKTLADLKQRLASGNQAAAPQVQRFAPGQTTGVPQWLPDLEAGFGEQASKDRTQRNTDLLSSVNSIAEPATRLAQETAAYRQAQAAARSQAQRESATARGEEIGNAIANKQYDFSGGGGNQALPTGAQGKRAQVLSAAKKLLGTPYLWGGGHGAKAGPSYGSAHGYTGRGIDCSGLVRYAFESAGLTGGGIAGTTLTQMPWASAHGKRVPTRNLVPGDLVFGGDPSAPHHVAIYWGDGRIIEAMQTGTNVHIVPMRPGQYGMHLNY